jgi:hypothetical protein
MLNKYCASINEITSGGQGKIYKCNEKTVIKIPLQNKYINNIKYEFEFAKFLNENIKNDALIRVNTLLYLKGNNISNYEITDEKNYNTIGIEMEILENYVSLPENIFNLTSEEVLVIFLQLICYYYECYKNNIMFSHGDYNSSTTNIMISNVKQDISININNEVIKVNGNIL